MSYFHSFQQRENLCMFIVAQIQFNYLQKMANFTQSNLELQRLLWETWDLPNLAHVGPLPSHHPPLLFII